MNRRQRERAWEEERKRQAEEYRQKQAREQAARDLGEFIMEADEHRLALIEQFGVTALWGQWRENREAYRRETKRAQQQHARQTMQDALALALKQPAPACRIVLYTEPRRGWGREDTDARRKRALADLERLGLPVEYANPNAEGDG